MKLFQLIVIIILSTGVLSHVKRNVRQKRFLIVPQTAPTRHQYIVGVGIPVDTKLASIVSGWVIKAQYYLPVSTQDLKTNFIPGIFGDTPNGLSTDEEAAAAQLAVEELPTILRKRKRDIKIDDLTGKSYETYTVDVEDITGNSSEASTVNTIYNDLEEDFDDGDDAFWFSDDEEAINEVENATLADLKPEEVPQTPSNSDSTKNARWIAYKALQETLDRKGMHGRACVLRSICEAADTQFSHHSGLLGELFHIMFTPSTTAEKVSENSDNEYLLAEKLGKENAPCARVFSECEDSFLDLFTGVHFPFNDFASILKLGL